LDGSEDPEEDKAEEEGEVEELGMVENRSGPQFLAGVHICMFGFDQDEVREVRKVVSKSGGTISDGRYKRKHNYFMAPHGNLEKAKAAQSEISRTNASVPPLVSSYWIERCIAVRTPS
jgi:hypothetical protein